MPADAWRIYHNAKEYIGDGRIDLDAGDAFFAVVLLTSAYVPSLSHDAYSDISPSEVASGNGYASGGITPANTAWINASGIVTFDSDDLQWTAVGGPLTARYAALVHVAAGSGNPLSTDKLIAYALLNNIPGDITAADGADLILGINANGYFQISGGGS